ncbi:MAG: FecR family protein [Allosphingosinicella sp.]|uniref:FecR family protein n=1 Tax=Allosphingosinicella sp. TaxID=2823234 RepID=UPI0039392420
MTDPGAPEPPRDQLMREAAAWFARMRGPDADASRPEFEAWLRRGALHRGAYNRASEIFAMGKLLSDAPGAGHGAARPRRLAPALMGLVAVAALGGLAIHLAPVSRDGGQADSASAPAAQEQRRRLASNAGEVRSLLLADGSRIVLAPGTVVEARLGASERRLDLLQGRARFDVFREARPFNVHAGGGTVTARGTIFDVEMSPANGVTVRLIEGAVDVALPASAETPGPGPAVRRLRPGEALTFATRPPAGRPAAPPETPAATAAAYPLMDAARDYDRVSVAELVAAANAASATPILLGDPAIGARRVSGHFRVDDTTLLAERLAILFGLEADRGNPAHILLRRR